jgi:hypothetical protein
VGRATETRGAAGVELTSAASADICELWDGQSAVRILGTPTILTVVYVGPDGALPAKTLRDAEWESLMNPDSDGEPEDSDDRVIDL